MYCTNCGARVGDVNFCQRCGAAVVRDEPGDTGRRETSRSARSSGARRDRVEDYVRDPKRTQELLSRALDKARNGRVGQNMADEVWEYLQLAVRLVQASVTGEYTGLSKKRLALILAAIVYYVSPIDIVPDFLPIAGFLDDMGILAFALRSVREELTAFKQWEADRGRRAPG